MPLVADEDYFIKFWIQFDSNLILLERCDLDRLVKSQSKIAKNHVRVLVPQKVRVPNNQINFWVRAVFTFSLQTLRIYHEFQYAMLV